jgi:hypothetical protein
MTRFIIVHLRAMEHGRWSCGYFNSFSLSTASPLEGGNEWPRESCGIAEVVGSTPTQSIFVNLVNYSIILTFF